jgi:hypothetical protein
VEEDESGLTFQEWTPDVGKQSLTKDEVLKVNHPGALWKQGRTGLPNEGQREDRS